MTLPDIVTVSMHIRGYRIVGDGLYRDFRNPDTAAHWLESHGYDKMRKSRVVTGRYHHARKGDWGIHWGRITIGGAFITCRTCGESHELAIDATHYGSLDGLARNLAGSGFAFDERNGWRCCDCVNDEKERAQ